MTSADMKAFLAGASVSPEVFALRPDYRALLLAVSGIKAGGPSDATSEAYLQSAEATARDLVVKTPINDLPHVSAWRHAYKGFGANPKKTRNSLEALTRRITPTAGLPRVNRLTDIYNAVSVKHQIPLGGEDLDRYQGSPRCIRANGGEKFETKAAGEVVVEHPDPGEVVWCDDAGVTCRRWNWRQGPRTALTEETTSVLFICDALGAMSDEALEAAADELQAAVEGMAENLKVERRLIAPANTNTGAST